MIRDLEKLLTLDAFSAFCKRLSTSARFNCLRSPVEVAEELQESSRRMNLFCTSSSWLFSGCGIAGLSVGGNGSVAGLASSGLNFGGIFITFLFASPALFDSSLAIIVEGWINGLDEFARKLISWGLGVTVL